MIGWRKYIQQGQGIAITQQLPTDMVEAMKKSIAEGAALSQTLSDQELTTLIQSMIQECDTQDAALKRVEAFQRLQAMLPEITKRGQSLYLPLTCLSFDNLDHPLTTVAAISKSMLRKVMTAAQEQGSLRQIIEKLEDLVNSRASGDKSRFLALNLMIDFLEPYAYLANHNNTVREVIEGAMDTLTHGKYALNFFDALLKKALQKGNAEMEKKWFDIWIDEYLAALKSDNESMRDAVCTLITPIVIKINKNSLPLILSTLLSTQSTTASAAHQTLPMQILEQVLILMKIARQNKMLVIEEEGEDPAIKLEAKCQESLNALRPDLPDFRLQQQVLMRLVLSADFKTSLSCIELVASETKVSLAIANFEYALCTKFIKHGLRTTFPEFRQKYIKAVKNFLIRVRTACDKDIKKLTIDTQPTEQLQTAIVFLNDILAFSEENLYLDKPVEAALPYFEIMRIIIELFGDFEYKLRVSQVFPGCCLLSKIGYFSLDQSRSLFLFLINSMKSTWAQVRVWSFEILCRFPESYPLLNDASFVNDVLLVAAKELANNPKAMMAEASALFHNLLFKKCLKHLHFIPADVKQSLSLMQLSFLTHVLDILKSRVKTFQVSLIKEGKKEALLHGYLSFFKHLFEEGCQNALSSDEKEHFTEWRNFAQDLLQTSVQIGNVCKGLLSNNGLMSDDEGGEGIGAIQVDCRGHPIKMDGYGAEGDIEDFENFILVGVWLAVKENGLTQLNLLRWLQFPASKEDDTKLVVTKDIENLTEHFLDLLFNFKHRGAIEKAAESFQLFCVKLLESKDEHFKSIPGLMLDKTLSKITTENLSTILRRSAGIPPTIIAILRAEPIQCEPVLLNRTIAFLLELARTADRDDSKVHALNILRFIFQDAMLRHDVGKFITPAMILATESFNSGSWSIRNSALMAFTALTKRLINNLHVQDQDLARTKGLSVWEFLHKYHELSEYFLKKLREGLLKGRSKKEDKEKEDLVIFSILLLISRLIPSFQLVEFEGDATKADEEEKKQHEKHSKEAAIRQYVDLLKQYSGNTTYFVRKISAQAILPLIKFQDYVQVEIPACFEELRQSLTPGQKPLRQNHAHGIMVRLNVFLSAYLQYRDVATKQLGPGHKQNREQEEAMLIKEFEAFESILEDVQKVYSKVTVALFVKTYTKLIQNIGSYNIPNQVAVAYMQRFEKVVGHWGQSSSQKEETKQEMMSGDEQIFLQEVARFLTVTSLRANEHAQTFKVLRTIVNCFTCQYSDFVYTFLGQFNSALKKQHLVATFNDNLCEYIVNDALPAMFQYDEKHCKVTELLLKLAYHVLKKATSLPSTLYSKLTTTLFTMMDRFSINPAILSHVLKLLAVVILRLKEDNPQGEEFISKFTKVAQILSSFSPMEHKEQVRISVSKALARLLPLLSNPNPIIFPGILNLLYSLIMLLNDEQPDIRYYLCESETLMQLLGQQDHLNDQYVQELLFHHYTTQVKQTLPADLQLAYAKDFLLKRWITGNPYREHLAKNFEDKIFFFEPLNKFFDLLWVKRLAFKQLLQVIPPQGIPQEEIGATVQSVESIEKRLAEYYNEPDSAMKQQSIVLEQLAQDIMLARIANPQVKIQMPKDAESFIRSLID